MFNKCCNQMTAAGDELESKPKLAYFDMPASRGDAVRLCFKILDRAFTDHRFSEMEFMSTERAKAPTHQVPYLELPSGKTLSSTVACMLYAAQNSTLYPVDPLNTSEEHALMIGQIHQILSFVDGIYGKYFVMRQYPREERPAHAAEVTETAAGIWAALDKAIGHTQGGSGFCVANSLTVADIAVFCLVGFIKVIFQYDKIEGSYRNIARVCHSVRVTPKVADYLAERQCPY